jgi:predicted MPP superfamily phosphohydrolase
VTPERYGIAVIAFHAMVLTAVAHFGIQWLDRARCELPIRAWLLRLLEQTGALALVTYAASLASAVGVNLDFGRRVLVGQISGRLMGQALFGETILLGAWLAVRHRRANVRARAAACAGLAFGLFGVYVEAYRIEPGELVVRRHVLRAPGRTAAGTIRILHLTDIQTPAIGRHEEQAFAAGLAYRPDLVVLTGDYVQDALGEPTEERAAYDLRLLLARLELQAPLGVYATEGDVGPPCREVFARSIVRCLTDESALVRLPAGDTLKLIGLSRGRGRERNPAWLGRMLDGGPRADHTIVISHAPDFVDALPRKVDLVLAGHTHGGQFVLPFFGPLVTASRLPRRYAGGLNDYRGTPLHVSRGVGMERGFAPPVRFLCPPEICVLDVSLGRASQETRRAALSEPLHD